MSINAMAAADDFING